MQVREITLRHPAYLIAPNHSSKKAKYLRRVRSIVVATHPLTGVLECVLIDPDKGFPDGLLVLHDCRVSGCVT
jgi:hypothetical protein